MTTLHPTGSSSSTIKSHNLSAVLLTLLRRQQISRVRLAQLTGLSTTTITNLIAELLQQGIVAQVDVTDSPDARRRRGVGRPKMPLRLVPEARYAIGVHIGVGSVRIGITDLLAQPVYIRELEHPLDRPPQDVLAEIQAGITAVVEEGGIERHRIVGVGVGASGLVDPVTGVNILSPNLHWRDVPVHDLLAQQLPCPVIVDNNVRAMALGEALFGAGQDVYSLAFVYARIGVGAGITVGGRLYYGGGAGAGEIGHTFIVADCAHPDRAYGTLETLVSEPVIVSLARQIAAQQPEGILARHLNQGQGRAIECVFAAARAGDRPAQQMLHDRACYMGLALANLVNILNPELIVLGGIFDQGEDLLLPVVRQTVQERAFANLGEKVRLQTSTFKQDAGVIGAAALALNAFFYQQLESTTS